MEERSSQARKYLTKKEIAEMLLRQGGKCAAAGCESKGPFEADHSTPHAFLSKKPDQLLCKTCHLEKTRQDVKNIAKAKRLSGETSSQYTRRKRNGSKIKKRVSKWPKREFPKKVV